MSLSQRVCPFGLAARQVIVVWCEEHHCALWHEIKRGHGCCAFLAIAEALCRRDVE